MTGPVGFLFFCSTVSSCLGERVRERMSLLQLSLLTATVHLLDQHCSGSQIMLTLKLLAELEDETSLIKTVFFLGCLTALFMPQVWFWFVVVVGFFNLLGLFLTWQRCNFSGFG